MSPVAPHSTSDVIPPQAPPLAVQPPEAPLDPLLTYEQAGKVLGVCSRTVVNLARRGELPIVRIGRAVRIDPRDLALLVERKKLWNPPRQALPKGILCVDGPSARHSGPDG